MKGAERYQGLLEGYEQGIYTDQEVVGQVFDMIVKSHDREPLWQALTPEPREELARYLNAFDRQRRRWSCTITGRKSGTTRSS